MFCPKCGVANSDDAKFCSTCGQPLASPSNKCVFCGAALAPGAQFCPECGSKVQSGGGTTVKDVSINTGGTQIPAKPKATGRLLYPAKQFAMYEGEPTVGISKAQGPLTVYDDRIEFKKTFGNALASSFGLLGMALAKKNANKDPQLIIPVSQIAQLRVGSYGGIYKTLVVVQKDGTVISFAPAVPGSSLPQNIIDVLQPYIN